MSVNLVDIYHIAVTKLENKGFEPKQGAYVNITMIDDTKDYIVDIPVYDGDNQSIIVTFDEIMKYISGSSTSTKYSSIW